MMFKWLWRKWVLKECLHLCVFCRFKERCKIDREYLYKRNKPP